jgi:hypothetical protein
MWKSAGRAPFLFCEFYPGICLTTEEKAWKNLSQGKKNLSQVKKTPSQSRQTSWHVNFTLRYRSYDRPVTPPFTWPLGRF